MGLDVIFRRKGEDLSWDDRAIRQGDFPFQIVDIPYDIYGPEGEIVDVGYQPWVSQICGMVAIGSVSFCGKGYSHFASQAGLPYDFYHDFSSVDLKDMDKALFQIIVAYEGKSDDIIIHGLSLGRIRALYKLLHWAATHGLETAASY